MDEETFPEEADGVITFLNTERLSRRKDTLGDIFHDLLIPGNEEQRHGKEKKGSFLQKSMKERCVLKSRNLLISLQKRIEFQT